MSITEAAAVREPLIVPLIVHRNAVLGECEFTS